jgi:hypothetical protein
MGRSLMGGAGLDKLIAYSRAPMHATLILLLRNKAHGYTLHCQPINRDGENPLQQLYDLLHPFVLHSSEQWYFLHEEIPFADEPQQ